MEKLNLIDMDGQIEWIKSISRMSPLLWRNIELTAYKSSAVTKYTGVITPMRYKVDENSLNLCKEDSIKMRNEILHYVEKDYEYVYEIYEKCLNYCKEYLAFCIQNKNIDFANMGLQELAFLFEEYITKNIAVTTFRPIVFYLDGIISELIKKEISRLQDEGEQIELNIDIIVTKKDLPFVEQQKDLLKIGELIENNEELKEIIKVYGEDAYDKFPQEIRTLIDEHTFQFGWITTQRLRGKPLEIVDVLKSLKELIGNCKKKLNQIEEIVKAKQCELESLKNKSTSLKQYLEAAQIYAYLRTYRMDIIMEGDYLMKGLYNEIATRCKMNYDDLIYCTLDEIMHCLYNMDIDRKTIEKRKRYFVSYLIDDEIYTYEPDNLLMEECTCKISVNEKITGMVAQRGCCEGFAAIVKNRQDLEKVNKDSVIISPMTTPEMIIGIIKAKGIVTDEGGIACHAAQISREFKIPCIIGTQKATKIIKDGDYIELCANGVTGNVTIKNLCKEKSGGQE